MRILSLPGVGAVVIGTMLSWAAHNASATQPTKAADNIYNWPDLAGGMWMPVMRGFSLASPPAASTAAGPEANTASSGSAREGGAGSASSLGGATAAKKVLKPEILTEANARRDKLGTSAACHPIGPVSMHIFATKLYFTPGEILIMTDTDMLSVRHVYMDGRTHKGVDPSFHGHSVGHWEGKTLVVDTVQLSPTVQSIYGALATPMTHVVERFMLMNAETMHLNTTVEDPSTQLVSYHQDQEYVRHREWEIQDVTCEEGDNRDAPNASGGQSLNLTPPP